MKIAVTATGNDPAGAVDQRFGRAKCFFLFDTEEGTFTFYDNAVNLNALQGAGIQSAKKVVDIGAEAVVTGNVGPKAFSVLDSAGVSVYTGASGTVKDAVEAFQNGALTVVEKATVEGHW
ncbi:MAG: NifB/NifX family molybdenum-iron cluster-binding protein [Candidatus Latescibacteria bacterium]|nr:NifB/NifX family molybdenum-iron cluster-binding protein [Candidatus Latescibacterota bacterium]